jgi:hypothetical protein
MDELLECCFKACGVESTDSTLCNFGDMLHSAESRLRAMLHSAESRLRAMLHSAESRFLALYCIERSRDSVLC